LIGGVPSEAFSPLGSLSTAGGLADAVTTGFFLLRDAAAIRCDGFFTCGTAWRRAGASTVTGGSVRSAVCARVDEGTADSAPQSTSVPALPKAG
jgi:hypothetical protein